MAAGRRRLILAVVVSVIALTAFLLYEDEKEVERNEITSSKPPKKVARRKRPKKRNITEPVGPPLFHQVLTTGTQTLSTVNIRSMESIFFIYPDARLHLHHNKDAKVDTNHPRLKPLFDEGYNITLLPYDPQKQLKLATKLSLHRDRQINETLSQQYINLIKPKYSKEKYWFSNEANLLRLCLLYTVGGTYFDTDVVLIKPLDDLDNAVAGSSGSSIHCAVLRFTKPGNPYLSATINNFMENFNGEKWGNNGPSAFRRTAESHSHLVCPGDVGLARKVKPHDGPCYVHILPGKTFAPVGWRDWEKTCAKSNAPVGKKAEALVNHSYAVHLNNQVTGKALDGEHFVKGSLCDQVLSRYCKVCP